MVIMLVMSVPSCREKPVNGIVRKADKEVDPTLARSSGKEAVGSEDCVWDRWNRRAGGTGRTLRKTEKFAAAARNGMGKFIDR
jgi:hypothetical protein